MSLPPIYYHVFKNPVSYIRGLSLQESIHQHQLLVRKTSQCHRDYLLLLEHRPVYTFGRRQLNSSETVEETERLTRLGADCVQTQRGGQTTYHGPGQIVGYPLIDLGRTSPAMGIRDYICRLQKSLENHLSEDHSIQHISSDNTGVFLDAHTKIASIGVQVRHRLTTHGFALNVTREPLPWFDQVVACGLADVKAGCIADASKRDSVRMLDEYPLLIRRFERMFGREIVSLGDARDDEEVGRLIASVEESAIEHGRRPEAPHR